ncbi:fatty acid desaturase [Luteibacter aegosomatis]|uniref:fatty acid desaturase family protein n=1 Tax=Luteibacter aegosomatis TaxID=2911537 RepID=UPI001FF7C5B1|nr:fatty acid desaturase [Luteibacter aegosomatis]UPG85807.1 fatty acid desaturase [Luteibacter aegosomatis]
MNVSQKPALPVAFRRTNNLAGLLYIVHGTVLWLGSAFLAYALWHANLPWPARGALVVIPVVASGFGMFYMGSLGHEGFHGNLNRQADISMVMGIVASLGAPLFLSVGVNIYHWRHHKYTNTPKDPDLLLYQGLRTPMQKLRVSLDTNVYCVRNVWNLLRGRETPDKSFPLGVRRMRFYAALDGLLVATATVGYAMLAWHNPGLFVFVVLVPALVAQLYWSLHPFIEHGDLAGVDGSNARNCTSPVLTFLLLGYTYHLCHHLYPGVQTHRLPALHKHLRDIGYLVPGTTETTFLGALKLGFTRKLPVVSA